MEDGVGFPSDFVLLSKAALTMETIGIRLYPEFKFNEQLNLFVNKILKSYANPEKALEKAKANIFDYLEFLKDLPERNQDLLDKMEKGNISVKLDTTELVEFKKEFDRQNDLRILGMILVAVVFCTAIFIYLENRTTIGGFPISFVGMDGIGRYFVCLVHNQS